MMSGNAFHKNIDETLGGRISGPLFQYDRLEAGYAPQT